MIPLHTRAALTTLYNEKHRHYHGLEHVFSLLRKLESSETAKTLLPPERKAIEYSIWFHDAVYDTRQPDAENVKQSAELAVDAIMRDGFGHVSFDGRFERAPEHAVQRFACMVHDMVMRTANHFGPFAKELTQAEQLFLDLDLSILGAEENDYYYQYALKVREEYIWVPLDIFSQKRHEILGKMLNQHFIFYTDEFRKLEGQARKNIENECKNLRSRF
jgi:predicted metal-dependent HD superfamily phosphohydrolase